MTLACGQFRRANRAPPCYRAWAGNLGIHPTTREMKLAHALPRTRGKPFGMRQLWQRYHRVMTASPKAACIIPTVRGGKKCDGESSNSIRRCNENAVPRVPVVYLEPNGWHSVFKVRCRALGGVVSPAYSCDFEKSSQKNSHKRSDHFWERRFTLRECPACFALRI